MRCNQFSGTDPAKEHGRKCEPSLENRPGHKEIKRLSLESFGDRDITFYLDWGVWAVTGGVPVPKVAFRLPKGGKKLLGHCLCEEDYAYEASRAGQQMVGHRLKGNAWLMAFQQPYFTSKIYII